MEYITLKNNIKMPLLGLGTWDLRGQECIDTVCTAIKNGYRLIDTAQMYGNEKEVGQGIIKSQIPRHELFITTKIYGISNSYEKAKKAIRESLTNLQTDYIDLLLLHEPYLQEQEMYKAIEEAYRKGTVRAIGISNYEKKKFEKFLKQCRTVPLVNQVECHIYYQKWEYQEYLNRYDVKMQAWAPLAQSQMKIEQESLLLKIAKKYHKTPYQIALRFLTQRGISVIPKSRREEKLIENINIFDFQLTQREIREISSLDKNDTLFMWTKYL